MSANLSREFFYELGKIVAAAGGHIPYETALQRGDLICMYKIMHGLLDFPCDAVFAALTRIGLRGHTNSGVRLVVANLRSASE